MKAILRFSLPEEQEEFNAAMNGHLYKIVLSDLDHRLRAMIKWGAAETDEDLRKIDTAEEIRAFLHESLACHDLTLD